METDKKLIKLREFFYKTLIGNFVVLIIVFVLVFVLVFLINKYNNPILDSDSPLDDLSSVSKGDCNVMGLNLHGSILTYVPEHSENDSYFDYDVFGSEDIIYSINEANKDPKIKAIILEVDSSGGSPLAGEEISIAIKNSVKPIVALIRDAGLSASYLAISSADKIFASKYSDVGSIGVTMSYLNNVENNKNEGHAWEELSSGKFKDSGSPDRELTKEERDIFMRDVNIMYEDFIKDVSENRKIDIEAVRKFADGSFVLGKMAKELKLIDEIGGLPEVENYLEGIIGEKPEICWY